MERARFLRRGAVEILNSRDEWQVRPAEQTQIPLGEAWLRHKERWRPALSVAATLEGCGIGQLHKSGAGHDVRYHRELIVGTRRGGSLALAPSLATRFARHRVSFEELERDIIPQLAKAPGSKLSSVEVREEQLVAIFHFDRELVPVWIDNAGQPLLDPPERRDLPLPCRGCPEQPWCGSVEIRATPADAWRRLALIEPDGKPTRRGIVFSFFHHGEGLAVSAALEDEDYAIKDLVFDLANLRAGPRFAGDDSPFGGKLGFISQKAYDRADIPGYLTMGVPLDYGAGASEAMRAHVEEGIARQRLLTESLRLGDFERAFIEWRSILRHIVWAQDYDWDRWKELKQAASEMLARTEPRF